MDKKRILVIEDERESARFLQSRLKEENYEVLKSYNGQEGLKLAKSSKPDLILLDLVLPKIGGAQILQELKGDARYKSIPIIVMSSLSEDTQGVKTSALKPEAYFLKPFDFVELLTTIAALLKESRKE